MPVYVIISFLLGAAIAAYVVYRLMSKKMLKKTANMSEFIELVFKKGYLYDSRYPTNGTFRKQRNFELSSIMKMDYKNTLDAFDIPVRFDRYENGKVYLKFDLKKEYLCTSCGVHEGTQALLYDNGTRQITFHLLQSDFAEVNLSYGQKVKLKIVNKDGYLSYKILN